MERDSGSKSKFKPVLLIVFILVVLLVVYLMYYSYSRDEGLKDSSLVHAKITLKDNCKNCKIYNVEYYFNNTLLTGDFMLPADKDTLNVGDSVLLKVSNKHPNDFIELVRRIK